MPTKTKGRRSTCECGHPPLVQTPDPSSVPGAWFDQAAVDRVVAALRGLRHTKGRWAGRPVELEDWQLEHIVAPIFGWKGADGFRIVRTAWIELPRKNGKSTISSGLALVLLAADGEMGAEVYAAAASKDQAKIVHEAAKQMARRAPQLRGKLKALADVITVPGTGGLFRALSKIADAAHGLNVSGAVIDEVHVHKNRDLIDAIETGTGAREQPLVIFITTADEGEEHSIYAEKHTYTRQVAAGVVADPSHFGVIWAADPDDDPFDPATWRKANPGLGVTVSEEYLAKEAQKAKASPAYKPVFCRLHLNVRARALSRFVDLGRWDAGAGMVDPLRDFKGRVAYGGLDLSSTTDFTAAALLAPQDAGGWLVHPMFWIPEDRLGYLEDRTGVPLSRWAAEGLLKVTEGNVVDYGQVRQDFADEVALLGCKVAEIAYDPWNATETVLEMAKSGYVMVPTRQGYATLSPACKELDRLIQGSTPQRSLLLHGGHPVLRWNADCLEVRQDPSGNLKPEKPDTRKATKRIDGMAALINALTRAMLRNEPQVAPQTATF